MSIIGNNVVFSWDLNNPQEKALLDRYWCLAKRQRQTIPKNQPNRYLILAESDIPFFDRWKLPNIKPYVQTMIHSRRKRPNSLEECLAYFYSRDSSSQYALEGIALANFMSTCPLAYKGVGLPAELGELSYTYFWFIVYRMLLCPKRFGYIRFPNQEEYFLLSSEQVVRNEEKFKYYTDQLTNSPMLKSLKIASSLVDVAKSATMRGFADGDFTFSDFQSVLMDVAQSQEGRQAISGAKQSIISSLGLSRLNMTPNQRERVANGFINFLQTGNMPLSLEEIEGLGQDSLTKAFEAARNYGLSKGLPKNLFSEVIDTEDPLLKFILDKKVEPKIAQYLENKATDDSVDLAVQEFIKEHLTLNDEESVNVLRSNPEPLTMLAVSGVAMGIKAGLGYIADQERTNINRLIQSEVANIYTLDPILDFTFLKEPMFQVSDAYNGGVWQTNTFTEDKWATPPTCELQMGRESKDYFNKTLSVFSNIVSDVRNGGNLIAALESKRNVIVRDFQGWSNSVFNCESLRLFEQFSVDSTIEVIKRLDRFSPFNFNFGWTPIFIMEQTSSFGRRDSCQKSFQDFRNFENELAKYKSVFQGSYQGVVSGKTAPRRDLQDRIQNFGQWLGRDSLRERWGGPLREGHYISGSGSGGYNRNVMNGGPGRGWRRGMPINVDTVDRNNDGYRWENSKWQKTKTYKAVGTNQVLTQSSQRKLNGRYNCSLHYDVSFDVNVGGTNMSLPILNSQFVAMMSVLYCYPEALKTLSDSGVTWARQMHRNSRITQVYDQIEAELANIKGSVQSRKELTTKQKLIQSIVVGGSVAGVSYMFYKVWKKGKS